MVSGRDCGLSKSMEAIPYRDCPECTAAERGMPGRQIRQRWPPVPPRFRPIPSVHEFHADRHFLFPRRAASERVANRGERGPDGRAPRRWLAAADKGFQRPPLENPCDRGRRTFSSDFVAHPLRTRRPCRDAGNRAMSGQDLDNRTMGSKSGRGTRRLVLFSDRPRRARFCGSPPPDPGSGFRDPGRKNDDGSFGRGCGY